VPQLRRQTSQGLQCRRRDLQRVGLLPKRLPREAGWIVEEVVWVWVGVGVVWVWIFVVWVGRFGIFGIFGIERFVGIGLGLVEFGIGRLRFIRILILVFIVGLVEVVRFRFTRNRFSGTIEASGFLTPRR
jgi:hypothetical protein